MIGLSQKACVALQQDGPLVYRAHLVLLVMLQKPAPAQVNVGGMRDQVHMHADAGSDRHANSCKHSKCA